MLRTLKMARPFLLLLLLISISAVSAQAITISDHFDNGFNEDKWNTYTTAYGHIEGGSGSGRNWIKLRVYGPPGGTAILMSNGSATTNHEVDFDGIISAYRDTWTWNQRWGMRVGSDPNNAIEFAALPSGVSGSGNKVRTRTVSGGVATENTYTFPSGYVSDWKTYRIEATATQVKFYVDGALAATHTTNIPTGYLNLCLYFNLPIFADEYLNADYLAYTYFFPQPTLNSLTADSSSQITVNFTDDSTDESDFHIYRDTFSPAVTEVGSLTSTTTATMGAIYSYPSNGLSPSVQYFFRTRAHNNSTGVYTEYSNELSKYSWGNQPGSAAYSGVTKNSVRANWTKNGNPEGTGYLCENTTVGSTSYLTSDISWESGELSINTPYNFRVKARSLEHRWTAWTDLGPVYTLCNVPSLPGVTSLSSTEMNVVIHENLNPSNTTFSIKLVSSEVEFVQNNYTLGPSPVYKTKSEWGTINVSGLRPSTLYMISVNAKNGDGVPTDYSASVSRYYHSVTESTEADFNPGIKTSVRTDLSPGDVCLDGASIEALVIDDSGANEISVGSCAQSFMLNSPANLSSLSVYMAKIGEEIIIIDPEPEPEPGYEDPPSPPSPPTGVNVALKSDNSGVPGNTLGTAFIDSGSVPGSLGNVIVNFSSPQTIEANTKYWICFSNSFNPGLELHVGRNLANPYANGEFWHDGTLENSQDMRCTLIDLGKTYVASGNFISQYHDTGTSVKWNKLNWDPVTQNPRTGVNSLKFQIATNIDNSTWNFLGPDGTGSTYYTAESSAIWSGHNGDRYIEYKAFFNTDNSAYSPFLSDITIDYSPFPSAPGTPEDSGIYATKTSATWTWEAATDPGSGIIKYYICIGTTPGGTDEVNDLDIGNALTYTTTEVAFKKTYYAKVKAKNGAGIVGPYSSNSDGITIGKPVIYISPSGNDDSGSGTISDPLKTVQKGLNGIVPSGEVRMMSGTYNEHDIVWPNKTNLRLVISPDATDPATINAQTQGRIFYIGNVGLGLTIEGITLRNGSAQYGGCIRALNGANITLKNVKIMDCVGSGAPSGNGGAVFSDSNVHVSAINCIFKGNNSNNGGVVNGGYWSGENCVYYGNWDTESGAVSNGSNFSSKNSIFWGNDGPSIFSGGSVSIKYSDIQTSGFVAGTGNISSEPMFISTNEADPDFMKLNISSPCIDTGTSEGAPATDIAGDPRPFGAGYDMGASECQILPPSHLVYISPSGSDEAGDGTIGNPYQTVQKGLDSVAASGEVRMMSGTYDQHDITWPNKTDIKLVIDPGATEPATIDAQSLGRIISVESAVSLTIEGITLTNGRFSDSINRGAGILLANGANLTLKSVNIMNCLASFPPANGCDGGAVYSMGSAAKICAINSFFKNNKGMYGGVAYSGTWTANNCTFESNSCFSGGCVAYGGTWEATNCLFNANNTAGEGGVASGGGNWSVKNCIFKGNTSSFAVGGVVSGGTWSDENCVYYGNTCQWVNGAVCYNTIFTSKNSILWGNTGPTIFFGDTVSIEYSDIQTDGWVEGTGNISAEPGFVSTDPASGDFMKITSASPCKDTGTSEGAPSTDFYGNPRPAGAGYDMGIYEVQGLPPTGIGPTIEAVWINGLRFRSGDLISKHISLEVMVSSEPGGVTLAEMQFDEVHNIPLTFIPASGSLSHGRWAVDYNIPPASQERHIMIFHLVDSKNNETYTTMEAVIKTGGVQVIGRPNNYPNPFSPMEGGSTTIQYTLSTDATITIMIYDISGHEIKRMKFSSGSAGGRGGTNQASWDGKSIGREVVGNGMYFYKIISGNEVIGSGKVVVFE